MPIHRYECEGASAGWANTFQVKPCGSEGVAVKTKREFQ